MKNILKIACAAIVFASTSLAADYASFENVGDASKPWCYWWWVNGNVDKETMTSDLESMKKIGFGGCLMFDARGYWDDPEHLVSPKPACEFMDETWRGHFKYAISEAERLGLEMSSNLSSCAGRLKGPWNLGADVPKRLICKISPLPANHPVTMEMSRPARKHAWNVATFAIKYDGSRIEKSSDWLNAGDGLYSMMATSGMKIKDNDVVENRNATHVIDVSNRIDKSGMLKIKVMDGNWVVVQFYYTTLDDHDFDVDVLDKGAVSRYYNRMAGALKEDLGDLYSKVLTHFYSVSWEGSVPTWTGDLSNLFKKYVGYDIEKWLPVLAGFAVEGKERSDKFMTDFRRARNLCFRDNFYQAMIDLAHAEGLLWHSESGGPWSRKPQIFGEADQMSFLGINDMPQGEFWVSRERFLIKPIANAAHIYGRNIVAAESFTHMAAHWSASPSILKPAVDKTFCDGANQIIWHTYTCSPKSFGKPGIEYFAGTHINGNVTWQAQVAPFLEYIARCQFMLRQGLPIVDFCAYTGDNPYQDWGRWKDKFGKDSKVKIPRGYSYDILNNDVLLNRAKLVDGKLTLSDGLAFKAMIVELESPLVSPAALAKILELKNAGFPIICIGEKPSGAAGLGENSTRSRELGEELFANSPTLEEYLASSGLRPDFDGKFDATHRADGDCDIYFVAGDGAGTQTFRVRGIPELWNPIDGSRAIAKTWRQNADGTTSVDLNLPQNGSMFVVFNKGSKMTLPTEQNVPVQTATIEGAWNVEFEPSRGAPKSAVFEKLAPWNENADEGIRYFSGVAKYSKTVDIKKVGGKMYIEFEDVSVVAEVFLNGKNCGVAWTSPWRVEITDAVKDGENKLEINVANTWVNRLIGDAFLPPEKRVTKSNMSLSKEKRKNVYSGFSTQDKLQKSGLCGAVKILAD